MLITAHNFPTTQRLSLKFTLVNKSHSQHSVVAVASSPGPTQKFLGGAWGRGYGSCSFRTPFSNFVCMRVRNLVPRPNYYYSHYYYHMEHSNKGVVERYRNYLFYKLVSTILRESLDLVQVAIGVQVTEPLFFNKTPCR